MVGLGASFLSTFLYGVLYVAVERSYAAEGCGFFFLSFVLKLFFVSRTECVVRSFKAHLLASNHGM